MEKYGIQALVFGLVMTLAAPLMAAPRVYFDQSNYNVAPGGAVIVNIRIDGDNGVAGDQPVANGLFGYGVRSQFPAAKASAAAGSLTVPAALDFNISSGALKTIGSGFAEVKGTVDFDLDPSVYYNGNLLASFTLNDLSLAAGNYQLTLGLHSLNVGNHFVDGVGNVLDDSIEFGTANVTVVPEPAMLSVLALGGILFLRRAR